MIAGRVPGRKMNLFNMGLHLIILEEKNSCYIIAACLQPVDLWVLQHCSHCRSSNLFQLLSDKGEYKEAMEVLKKALKLEPATKVRLCGRAGSAHSPSFFHVSLWIPSIPHIHKGKVILKLSHHYLTQPINTNKTWWITSALSNTFQQKVTANLKKYIYIYKEFQFQG